MLRGVTEVIFAVDAIPAIFAITTAPFIVLTSNVFAVLGLRAMFFLLAGLADRFHLLPYGLAVVLVFIGTKMLLIDMYKIPVLWSLAAVAVILASTIALSLARPVKPHPAGPGCQQAPGALTPEARGSAPLPARMVPGPVPDVAAAGAAKPGWPSGSRARSRGHATASGHRRPPCW